MATKKDYYQSLGIAKSATEAEIKSAYRKLARQHHPDIDKSAGAADKFKEISEAYQVLSDPSKRKSYDQFGHNAPGANPFAGGQGAGAGNPFEGFSYSWSQGGQSAGQGFEDPFSLFEQIFGGGFGDSFSQGFRQRQSYQLDLTFDEAVNGVEKEVEIQRLEGPRRDQVKTSRMKLKIPAGVDNGMKMRFGDVDIVFRVRRHPEFNREGSDIFTDVTLGVPQVVLGNVIDVKTVHGKVKLKVPAGTQSGSLIRIKGKGAPTLKGTMGDHYVRVKVEIPARLTDEEKRLYEQLANLKLKKKNWF